MTASEFLVPLAATTPTADEVKPGWVALLIVFAMGVALALLMWSMVRQFRKVDFEEEPDGRSDSTDMSHDQGDDRETNGSSR